jgi:SAM-dependent methyltransferase
VLNWLIRYAPAMARLESLGPLGSILDVGCGSHGLACVRPEQPFVGLEIAYHGLPTPSMVPFMADGGPLPWRDAAFDTVLCLDVLEHVPPRDRPRLIAELARVAARQVLVACPSSLAQPVDDVLRERMTADGGHPPDWLQEHYDCGLPTPRDVEALVLGVEGFAAEPVPMVNATLGTMIVMADMDPEFSAAASAEYASRAADWSDMLASACFGESLRVAWRMRRLEPNVALVGTDDLERDAVRAMRLPGARLVCPDSAAAPPLDTDARLRLWLSAGSESPRRWTGPLETYLTHAPVDGSTCLCLDVSTRPDIPEEVAAVCLGVCGEAPFGDVLLVDGTPVPRDAVPVQTSHDVRAALAVDAR